MIKTGYQDEQEATEAMWDALNEQIWRTKPAEK